MCLGMKESLRRYDEERADDPVEHGKPVEGRGGLGGVGRIGDTPGGGEDRRHKF